MTVEPGEEAEHSLLTRIGQAVMLHTGGDREEARNRLAALWEEVGEEGDSFHRCALAYYLADAQEHAVAALEWDRRALAVADALTAGDRPGGSARSGEHRQRLLAVRALYPALYLHLAADQWELGRSRVARRELDRARAWAEELGADAYAAGVRTAIARLEARLSGPPERPSPPGGPAR